MKRFAHYELLDQLQPGNHGTFHLARTDRDLGIGTDRVALKILDRHATDNEFKRMAAELEVLIELDHPRLVQVVDAGHHRGRLYYAMRYYDEGSLPLGPATDLVSVATQVADAADAAHALHEAGVVHRDIKPTNILIRDGRGHLSDLGVANYADAQFTTTGSSPVGTLAYADPRLVHGDRPGRASDIWSLGATLHAAVTGEMILGRIPDRHLAEAIEYVLDAEARIAASCPAPVAAVIRRATMAARADRHATAAELGAELRAVAADLGAGDPRTPPPVNAGPLPAGPPVAGNALPPGGTAEPVEMVGLLDFGDGRTVVLTGDVVVGRQPDTHPRVADGTAIGLPVEADLSLSRAHALIEVSGTSIRITDISSNGTELHPPGGGTARVLEPGEGHVLADGDVLALGQQLVTFRSRHGR